MKTKLLLVEDEPVARNRLLSHLQDKPYEIEVADTLEGAFDLYRYFNPELVLLDLKLPDGSGFSFAKQVQKQLDVGLIIITSLNSQSDVLRGLKLGADHYLTKPVDLQALCLMLDKLRQRVHAYRAHQAIRPNRLFFSGWVFDLTGAKLTSPQGDPCPITQKEVEILKVFTEHPHICLSRERLLILTGRGDQDVLDRSIDSIITRLRRKIEPNPDQPSLITTIRGSGFMFCADVTSS
ncbi:response regulator transcription factor [Magnetococcus sp. PR-3]|uniref:response regulator transcription factor n=1 Tax=Magnetococcus sp. PR-3 TaxID=3120355 RepID=UPI002FCE469D